MTEDEAKLKRCCGPEGCGVRKPNPGMESAVNGKRYCIGSECMAWRMSGMAKVENRRGQLVERDEDGTGRWHYDGYCGLAGKP